MNQYSNGELNKFRIFLAERKAVIFDNSTSSRPIPRRLLSQYGVKPNSIETVDTPEDAIEKIRALKPHFLFCELTTETLTGSVQVIEEFRATTPGCVGTLVGCYTDQSINRLEAESLEIGADFVLGRPFSFQDLEERTIPKLFDDQKPNDQKLFLHAALIEYHKKTFDTAKSHFENALKLQPKDINVHCYLIQTLIALRDFAGADKALHAALSIEALDYRLLVLAFDFYSNHFQRDDMLFMVAQKIWDQFPIAPKRLQSYVRTAIQCKRMDAIAKFYDIFVNKDTITEPESTVFSAALLMLAKQEARAGEIKACEQTLKKAITASKSKAKVIQEAILVFLSAGAMDEAKQWLSSAPEEVKNAPEIATMELEYVYKKGSPADAVMLGNQLLNKKIETRRVYEIVIEKSIAMGRPGAAIQELIFQASKKFPDNQNAFEALLTTGQKNPANSKVS